MSSEIVVIPQGGVASVRGFLAGAVRAGIKEGVDRLDLGILYSQQPCAAAGVFTSNRVKAAPILLCQKHLADGRAQAIVANSGCANACTGEDGLRQAYEMAELTAAKLAIQPEDVLVASTGVIGSFLPMDRVRSAIGEIVLSSKGGDDLARAIMTTDTVPKQIAVRFDCQGSRYTVGGVAKGAGMIHPHLATMLCFLTTDAPAGQGFLDAALRRAVDVSFNMITIDGDSSTNDMVVVLANGLAAGEPLDAQHPAAEAFCDALAQVCTYLAKAICRDAEGATKLIEVRVEGAASDADARLAARGVAGSLLVKTAVYGEDLNWGRILAALGGSGADMSEDKTTLYLGGVCLYRSGRPLDYDERAARAALAGAEVELRLELGLGEGVATAWGCDITEEYVRLNSAYTT
ncbi:MAG: bifunctional glutamate N-acetyltransferase/amino-acid acetyltransferase ArgJ [Dehalococcoidia bacterium]|nr:bifunctional glutamate N-acetyltransferase/amino-acid acetyltransferase ArgJ [Dehalococcoidia bacterium]